MNTLDLSNTSVSDIDSDNLEYRKEMMLENASCVGEMVEELAMQKQFSEQFKKLERSCDMGNVASVFEAAECLSEMLREYAESEARKSI